MAPAHTVVANSLLHLYASCGLPDAALALFRRIPDKSLVSWNTTVDALAGNGDGDGKALSRDVLINNSLVDLYGKCGAVGLARQVFDMMPKRDITSWNVIILTLANHGCVRESVGLFEQMTRVEKVGPNAITFVAVLSPCNHGGLVEEGRTYFKMMVGEYGIKPRIEHYGRMVVILVRAGFIEEALNVVSGMNCQPDAIISFNNMV